MVKFVDIEDVQFADSVPIYYPGEAVIAFGDQGIVKGMTDTHVDIEFLLSGQTESVSLARVTHA